MSKKRKTPVNPNLIRGTYYLTEAGVEADEIRTLILRRRLQVLVHSCIYYVFNENLISDSTWSAWARELVELQRKYPSIAARVDYAKEFQDFDASTGFHLPTRNFEIMDKAQYLLDIRKEKANVRDSGHQAHRADTPSTVVRICFP